jgi:hypothetical protein
MFFQKDYVLRMIEMMGDFMRRIGEMLDDLHRIRMLDDASREHCGMDLSAARNLSLESLQELLAPQPRLMMSEILYIQAMQTSLKDEDREQILYRSARLLLSLRDESLLCELRHERLTFCLDEARELITPRDRMDAAAFFVNGDQFEKGEDQLFQALDEAAKDEYPGMLLEGEKLMTGCLTVPENRLKAGGLPLSEVRESIRAIEKRRETLITHMNGAHA